MDKEILSKHNIDDENLANALTDLFIKFYQDLPTFEELRLEADYRAKDERRRSLEIPYQKLSRDFFVFLQSFQFLNSFF